MKSRKPIVIAAAIILVLIAAIAIRGTDKKNPGGSAPESTTAAEQGTSAVEQSTTAAEDTEAEGKKEESPESATTEFGAITMENGGDVEIIVPEGEGHGGM